VLLIDDLLEAPVKGVFWIFTKVHQAAVDKLESQHRQTRDELSELYMQLETGQISEQEFEAREKVLLDQLEHEKQTLESVKRPSAAGAGRDREPTHEVKQ
jgi:hypothetical protein